MVHKAHMDLTTSFTSDLLAINPHYVDSCGDYVRLGWSVGNQHVNSVCYLWWKTFIWHTVELHICI